MYNVVCLKWGTKYSVDYVNILNAMVKRHTTVPITFYCITDDPAGIDEDIHILPIIPQECTGWWYKLHFFKLNELYGLEGITLTLDLDIVIVDNIDCFFQIPGKFCIEKDMMAGNGNNSSVMRIPATGYEYVSNEFKPEYVGQRVEGMLMWGDQAWITLKIKQPTLWDSTWIKSYKWQCVTKTTDTFRIPQGCKIVMFHGKPDPHERLNHVGQYWRV